jgi:NAD(P)-dependent dehydrogenase (short-subunit alcohol dehydrogenase family)
MEPTETLEGKVAIVTGAGSSGPGVGTGKAISVLLARAGAKVALVDKFPERAAETLALIEGDGGEAVVIEADLAEIPACQLVVEQTVAQWGRVDVLVNNAAIASTTNLLDTPDELYLQVVAINQTAPFMLCRAAIPEMIKVGGGAIVNITSIAAMRGTGGRGQAAYATSKAALMGLMTDLVDAFGKQNIRVNCVAPGIVDTPMRAQALAMGGLKPGQVDFGAMVPLGREGTAWDVAETVLFLVGPTGNYLTGLLIPVDGGKTTTSH